jgi:predicted metal-binding membrane protein
MTVNYVSGMLAAARYDELRGGGRRPAAGPRRPRAVAGAVLLASLGAWALAADRMRGMDAGPGTDLGGLGWFLGIWVTMCVAMMLPSAAPVLTLVAQLRRTRSAAVFVVGYLAGWLVYGLAAYAVYRAARGAVPAWHAGGAWVAGGALVLAGAYQLSPRKLRYLRDCRSPLRLLLHMPDGAIGAARSGFAYGSVCVGCCLALMGALFVLGVMSLFWMAAAGLAIAAEKLLPRGERWAARFAGVLVVLGIWVAAGGTPTVGMAG